MSTTHYRFRVKHILLATVTAFAAFIVGAAVVSAVDPFPGLPNDGRLNVVYHFGGDALYCVDANNNPTDVFDASAGFKLLNINGDQLWSAAPDEVAAAVAQAQANPGEPALVKEAVSSYGTSYLYALVNADNPDVVRFIFAANDEHGKQNTIELTGCTPVGPIPGGGGSDSSGGICAGLSGDPLCACANAYCLPIALANCDPTDPSCIQGIYFPCFNAIVGSDPACIT